MRCCTDPLIQSKGFAILYFVSDYSEGAHPLVPDALVRSNTEPLSGYGTDHYTTRAKEKIRTVIRLATSWATTAEAVNSLIEWL